VDRPHDGDALDEFLRFFALAAAPPGETVT
jgi:hypothetical protein